MTTIQYSERAMTKAELDRMRAGFDEHTVENCVAIQDSQRFDIVASHEDGFVGCATGLAYKNGDVYSGWFYLTDLYVETAYRKQGVGAKLLSDLEKMIAAYGVARIWTWTAGYEAPGFYKRQGYSVFAELEDWYSNGDSRVGVRKTIR